jgi:hypothetical protein
VSDPDLTGLPAEALLEAFETLRISVSADGYTAAGYDQLGALRAELLRRLADRDRLAGVVRRALDAGHCHPSAGSDAGECLVDHCTLTLRDLIALREANARLRQALTAVWEQADDELRRLGAVPGSVVSQIEADARAALAADEG